MTHLRAHSRARRRRAAEVFDDHGAALFAAAWLLTGAERGAELLLIDVIEHACTESSRARDRLDERELRRTMTRRLLSQHAAVFGSNCSSARDADEFVPRGRSHFVVTVLRELSDEQRAALVLCAFGAHTYREAADLLGMCPAEAAEHLRAALCALAHARKSDQSPP